MMEVKEAQQRGEGRVGWRSKWLCWGGRGRLRKKESLLRKKESLLRKKESLLRRKESLF